MQKFSMLGLVVMMVTALGCNRIPSEVPEAAKREAMQRVVEQSLAEEHEKDRRMRENASPEALPSAEEQATTRMLARVKRTLLDPDSMQVRDLHLKDGNTVLCAEVKSRNRFGGYVGYTPVIVTSDRILLFKTLDRAKNLGDIVDHDNFLELNERLRCWQSRD